MKEKLKKFIEENSLTFIGEGSGLNSDCTVISGYADNLGVIKPMMIIQAIEEAKDTKLTSKVKKEVKRVFEFAQTYSYGKWWTSDEAKRLYKF